MVGIKAIRFAVINTQPETGEAVPMTTIRARTVLAAIVVINPSPQAVNRKTSDTASTMKTAAAIADHPWIGTMMTTETAAAISKANSAVTKVTNTRKIMAADAAVRNMIRIGTMTIADPAADAIKDVRTRTKIIAAINTARETRGIKEIGAEARVPPTGRMMMTIAISNPSEAWENTATAVLNTVNGMTKADNPAAVAAKDAGLNQNGKMTTLILPQDRAAEATASDLNMLIGTKMIWKAPPKEAGAGTMTTIMSRIDGHNQRDRLKKPLQYQNTAGVFFKSESD